MGPADAKRKRLPFLWDGLVEVVGSGDDQRERMRKG